MFKPQTMHGSYFFAYLAQHTNQAKLGYQRNMVTWNYGSIKTKSVIIPEAIISKVTTKCMLPWHDEHYSDLNYYITVEILECHNTWHDIEFSYIAQLLLMPWTARIAIFTVYKHSFCHLNVPTIKTKELLNVYF